MKSLIVSFCELGALAVDHAAAVALSIRAGFGIFHSVIYSRDLYLFLQPPFLIGTQVGAPYLGTCATLCSPITTSTHPNAMNY